MHFVSDSELLFRGLPNAAAATQQPQPSGQLKQSTAIKSEPCDAGNHHKALLHDILSSTQRLNAVQAHALINAHRTTAYTTNNNGKRLSDNFFI